MQTDSNRFSCEGFFPSCWLVRSAAHRWFAFFQPASIQRRTFVGQLDKQRTFACKASKLKEKNVQSTTFWLAASGSIGFFQIWILSSGCDSQMFASPGQKSSALGQGGGVSSVSFCFVSLAISNAIFFRHGINVGSFRYARPSSGSKRKSRGSQDTVRSKTSNTKTSRGGVQHQELPDSVPVRRLRKKTCGRSGTGPCQRSDAKRSTERHAGHR